MRIHDTPLDGVVVVEPERYADGRGFFARTWCMSEFADRGLDTRVVQCNISYNPRKGTLRGMHYQLSPHQEVKLVRCTSGAIHDVAIDLRSDSPTFKEHTAVDLSAENRLALYIPEGCAHGFLTLEDDVEIFYQMSAFYEPSSARGVRWNDPAFGIQWPSEAELISERDASYPDFDG